MDINTQVQFKEADLSDAELMVDLHMAFSDEYNGKQEAAVEENLRRHLLEFFCAETGKGFISWYAAIENKAVAMVAMELRKRPGTIKNPSGKWGYIISVFTYPEYRRKGISSLLLNKIIESARLKGYTAFELHATKDGEPMYLKHGFEYMSEPTLRKYIR